MRDLPVVIDQILEKIPVGAPSHHLIAGLKSIKQSSLFAAPEVQLDLWRKTQQALMDFVPTSEITAGSWQEKVLLIWTDEPEGIRFTPEGGMYWGR